MMEQLIEDKAHCPDIALATIRLPLEQLQRHVERSSNGRFVLHLASHILLSEAKIGYLQLSAGNEDISRLHISAYREKVPMYDAFPYE